MKTYKAHDNSLHVLEPEFAYMLPAGCVEITEEEAEAIRAANTPQPDPVQQVIAQIGQIERETLMNRAAREFLLEQTVRETSRDYNIDLTVPGNRELVQDGLYNGNLGYRKVKDIDTQIAALRAQIGAA